jgi:glycerol-3-phosphate dehydrogenase subunit C
MGEGSLDAPCRHAIDWEDPDYAERAKTEAEMQRVFDVCHTCRRCFNLCDSFPRLFELIDNSATGEVDAVARTDYAKIADACTLCDMCFMTKCPYVPPHEFNIDFPHLMLRYRAVEAKEGRVSRQRRELAETDRNGKAAGAVAPLANWAGSRRNRVICPVLEKAAGIDRRAALPKFHGRTFAMRAKQRTPQIDCSAPAWGRKAVLYATCFVNYNNPGIGEAVLGVLARNGVETEIVYQRCCSMPQLEQGNLAQVADAAAKSFADLGSIDGQRLRRHCASPILRADAEVRMAAGPSRRSCAQKTRCRDLRCQRIHRRYCPPGGAGTRSPTAGRRCDLAARLSIRGRRTWDKKR